MKKCLILVSITGVIASSLLAADLAFNTLSRRSVPLHFADIGGVFRCAPNGDVYFLSVETAVVHRVQASDAATTRVALDQTPESGVAYVNLMQDMDISNTGQIFVPAMWNFRPKGGAAGVFIFDSAGHYQRTILLEPQVNVRHLALDSDGSLFVVGIDPAYFREAANSCYLLHKYTPSGQRTAAFSTCPVSFPAGSRVPSGPRWDRLSLEADRGRVWISGQYVYHLLPVSHEIRVFDKANGHLASEVVLDSPVSSAPSLAGSEPSMSIVWRVLPLSAGGYLAQWSIGSFFGQTQSRIGHVSLHDSRGRTTSSLGVRSPWTAAVPIYSGADGAITFLAGPPSGSVEFVRARVAPE